MLENINVHSNNYKKTATVTYIINTIVLVFCLRRKQYNEDKQHEWTGNISFLTVLLWNPYTVLLWNPYTVLLWNPYTVIRMIQLFRSRKESPGWFLCWIHGETDYRHKLWVSWGSSLKSWEERLNTTTTTHTQYYCGTHTQFTKWCQKWNSILRYDVCSWVFFSVPGRMIWFS